jgi:hypothetical protein
MPRIGSGLAGGEWPKIEPIIRETLSNENVEVMVYDLGRIGPDSVDSLRRPMRSTLRLHLHLRLDAAADDGIYCFLKRSTYWIPLFRES